MDGTSAKTQQQQRMAEAATRERRRKYHSEWRARKKKEKEEREEQQLTARQRQRMYKAKEVACGLECNQARLSALLKRCAVALTYFDEKRCYDHIRCMFATFCGNRTGGVNRAAALALCSQYMDMWDCQQLSTPECYSLMKNAITGQGGATIGNAKSGWSVCAYIIEMQRRGLLTEEEGWFLLQGACFPTQPANGFNVAPPAGSLSDGGNVEPSSTENGEVAVGPAFMSAVSSDSGDTIKRSCFTDDAAAVGSRIQSIVSSDNGDQIELLSNDSGKAVISSAISSDNFAGEQDTSEGKEGASEDSTRFVAGAFPVDDDGDIII